MRETRPRDANVFFVARCASRKRRRDRRREESDECNDSESASARISPCQQQKEVQEVTKCGARRTFK